eukprot:TRINITY_DN14017_c0_g3_i1.p1 TRINITY_DN14017_c0_g3~~TRINITY_DN14017_c0_g3_i1.p1  ORF type:complete len:397 (+),score=92.93 TRINITY_DN14017_c0_g3_i1:94-1191(+)
MVAAGTVAGQKTTEVPDAQKFDERSLLQYMGEKGVPVGSSGIRVRKFSYGQSNPTFFVETADGARRWVLRKKPKGKLIKSAHMVEREYRVMSRVGANGFPVPRVLFLCEESDVIGTPFYMMDFVKGRVPDNGLNSFAVSDRSAALSSIVSTLAKLHTYDIDAVGLSDYGRRGKFYERQIATMQRISDTQAQGEVPQIRARQELLDWFRANLPSDRTTIVHGDYKPDNCIMHPTEPRVLGVVDWELSTLGHPLSDLANLCLPYYIPKKGPLTMIYKRWGKDVPSMEEVHKQYAEQTGISYPIEGYRFAAAFAFFRLSVIVQGIVMRQSKGQASQQGPGGNLAAGIAMFNMVADLALGVAKGTKSHL